MTILRGPEDTHGLRAVLADLEGIEERAEVHRTHRREMERAPQLCAKTAALTSALGRNRRRP